MARIKYAYSKHETKKVIRKPYLSDEEVKEFDRIWSINTNRATIIADRQALVDSSPIMDRFDIYPVSRYEVYGLRFRKVGQIRERGGKCYIMTTWKKYSVIIRK